MDPSSKKRKSISTSKPSKKISSCFVQKGDEDASKSTVIQIHSDEISLQDWHLRTMTKRYSNLLPPNFDASDGVFFQKCLIFLGRDDGLIHLCNVEDKESKWKTVSNVKRLLKLVFVSSEFLIGMNDKGVIYEIQTKSDRLGLTFVKKCEVIEMSRSQRATQCYAYEYQGSVIVALVVVTNDNKGIEFVCKVLDTTNESDDGNYESRDVEKPDTLKLTPSSNLLFTSLEDSLVISTGSSDVFILNTTSANFQMCDLNLAEEIRQISLVSQTLLAYTDEQGSIYIHHLKYNSSVTKAYPSILDLSEKSINDFKALGQNVLLISTSGNGEDEFLNLFLKDPSLVDILNEQENEPQNAPLKSLTSLHNKKHCTIVECPIQERDLSEHELVQELRTFLVRSPSIEGLLDGTKDIVMRQNHVNLQLLSRAFAKVFAQPREVELLLVALSKLLGEDAVTCKTVIKWLNCAIDAHFYALVDSSNNAVKEIVKKAVEKEIRISRAFLGLENLLLLCQTSSKDPDVQQFYQRLSGYSIERISF